MSLNCSAPANSQVRRVWNSVCIWHTIPRRNGGQCRLEVLLKYKMCRHFLPPSLVAKAPVFTRLLNYDNKIISYDSLINIFPLINFLFYIIVVALDRDALSCKRLPSDETVVLFSVSCHPWQKMKNAGGRPKGF